LLIYYIVIFSMPYFRHPFWNRDFASGFTVVKIMGAVCLLYSLIYLARRHAVPRFFATPQSKWMILFLGICAFSFATKGQKSASDFINPIYMYFSSFVFFFITMIVIDSIKRLYWSMMAAIGSVGFASLYMLQEWRKGTAVWGAGYRPGWIVGDSNYFSVAALAVLPIAFELALVSPRRWQKLYATGCGLITFAAITLGASRGGFLGILLIVVYLILRSERPMRNLVRVLIVTIPFLLFAPNSPLHRLFNPAKGDTQSVQTHLAGWQAGMNMVKKNPLTGVGLGNYKLVVVRYDTTGTVRLDPHVAHNAYLEVAAEMGIPAFVVYVCFFVSAFLSLGKTRKRARAMDSNLLAAIALGMQAGLLGVWVGIFFVSGEYTRLFWFLLCMSMCMPALIPSRSKAKKALRQEREQPEPAFQTGEALVALG